MDPAEYAKLDRLEERMWWFAAAHANLLMLARDFSPFAAPNRVLDAGCGTGGLLAKLAADRPADIVIGLDADQSACTRARAKSARPVCRGSVNDLPFADEAFSTIFSADVLCHRDVDERQALRQFHRCLVPDGILVLNLPAYRYASYWNVLLFPLMVITRKLLPSRGITSDVKLYPAPAETLCRGATAFERALLKGGLRFPFGGSLIAIAGKSASLENAHV
jgi:SAM-dependent methyltransferase